MKTIKLKESDLTNIVKRIVNEASEPRIKSTVEPPERNIGKNTFSISNLPPKKPDNFQIRKEVAQNVIDRIIKYGDKYLFELDKINSDFPIKKDRYEQY
jgi:molybdopterin-biosynthesis enzyme MoeA-like protein